MNWEGSNHCLFEVLFQHVPLRTKENHKILIQDSQSVGQNLNLVSPAYKVEC